MVGWEDGGYTAGWQLVDPRDFPEALMLLRCSKCKGAFEIEPNPYKQVVYCSHCGTPLQVGAGAGHAAGRLKAGLGGGGGGGASAQSLAALAGQDAEKEEEASLEDVVRGPAVRAAGANPVAKKSVRVEPSAGGDLLGQVVSQRASAAEALGGSKPVTVSRNAPVEAVEESPEEGGVPADLGALAAGTLGAGKVRRPGSVGVGSKRVKAGMKQKKSSETGVLIAILVAGALVVVGVGIGAVVFVSTREKPAPKVAPRHDPGEMFTNVKPTGGNVDTPPDAEK